MVKIKRVLLSCQKQRLHDVLEHVGPCHGHETNIYRNRVFFALHPVPDTGRVEQKVTCKNNTNASEVKNSELLAKRTKRVTMTFMESDCFVVICVFVLAG